MMKTFLGASALATCLLLGFSGAPAKAEAVAPTLKINGFSSWNVFFTNQRNHRNGKRGPQPYIATGGSDLYFTIAGQSSSGLEYKYRISMNAYPGGDPIVEQNYIELKGFFGTFQIGDVAGPTNTMIKDTSVIIGGAGAWSSPSYLGAYNMSEGVVFRNDNIGDPRLATKIAYYTPEIPVPMVGGGVTFGIAYTPSTAHAGDGKWDHRTTGGTTPPGNRGLWMSSLRTRAPFGIRNISGGLTFKKDLGQKWSITLSGAGLSEKTFYFDGLIRNGVRIPMKRGYAYQVGGILSYDKVEFAAGYLDNLDSRLPQHRGFIVRTGSRPEDQVSLEDINRGNAGNAFNTGLAYTMGAYKVSGSYQRMHRKTDAHRKAAGNVYSATLDVTPFQGLKGYVEVNYVKTSTNRRMVAINQALLNATASVPTRAIGNNRAAMMLIGTAVSF